MLAYPKNEPNASPLPARVVGVGNAGVHLADRISMAAPRGAEVVAMNTDAQSLAASVAPRKSALGARTTRGLGAGGDPEIGHEAARESIEEIRFAVEGVPVVVVVAGLGGGTGSGAAPLVAAAAREAGAYVLALVTVPFSFEGRRRAAQAAAAEAALARNAHAVLRFENDRMSDLAEPRGGIGETFAASDALLAGCVESILGLLAGRGPMPVTLGALTAAFAGASSSAFFGVGESTSDNRAHEALESALSSPLLDRGRTLEVCAAAVVHISGPPSLSFSETAAIMREVAKHVPDEAQLFLGVSTWPDPMAPLSLSLFGMTGTEAARSKSRHSSTRSTPRPKAPPPPQTPPPAPTNTEPPELIPAADIPAPDTQQPSSPEPPGRLIPEEDESVPEPPPEKSAPAPKIRQETLQFEPVTRGRFAKSEPTIVGGEDLDVPTFLRIQKKS
jgi:cell division protein FtsZ